MNLQERKEATCIQFCMSIDRLDKQYLELAREYEARHKTAVRRQKKVNGYTIGELQTLANFYYEMAGSEKRV